MSYMLQRREGGGRDKDTVFNRKSLTVRQLQGVQSTRETGKGALVSTAVGYTVDFYKWYLTDATNHENSS